MLQHRKVTVSDEARREIDNALVKGELTRGPYIEKVEDLMRRITGCKYAVATSTGTMALQLAFECISGRVQDELDKDALTVGVPDLGFIVDASIPFGMGHELMWIDVETDTHVISERYANGPGADVIIAVHMGGVEAPIIRKPVVYDSAHRIGRCPGVTSIFSFHPSKIISGIEGGCVTTDDEDVYEYVKAMRMFGFIDGRRYVEQAMYGHKGMMTNISAIVVYHNLLQVDEILHARAVIRDTYNEKLGLSNTGLGMYMVMVKDPDDPLLVSNGFVRHYPRTLSWQFSMGEDRVVMQNALRACNHLISVPFHEHMTDNEVDTVVQLLQGKLL